MLDAAIVMARSEAAEKTGRKPAPLVPWRLHDLRRSGVSALARLGFDSIVVDKILAHQPAKSFLASRLSTSGTTSQPSALVR